MTFRTITKEQLLQALEEIPDGAAVAFSSNYGHYARTQQVHRLRGEVEEVFIEPSGYSESGYAVARGDEGDDLEEDEGADSVWIIR